jgi:hypothetical protein
MTIDPASVALAKQFEPILLFHPNENFFPVDPKFYLERCALWRNTPPSDNKTDWGEPPPGFPRKPQLTKGQIVGLKSEATGGKTWIGDTDAMVTEPTTERPLTIDRFLQLTGWEPFVSAPNEVTATSANRHPTLPASFYQGALQGGRSWYYCEYLSHQQLLSQFGSRTPSGLDLFHAVIDNPLFSQPGLLVYHFFYPLHEEALQGCEAAGEGGTFATFAGEWSCVAILINSANVPLLIGATSRNVGPPTSTVSEENRVGITVFQWSFVDTVGQHPKIYVSRGTHGNYLKPGLHPAVPFTPGDIDLNQGTCAEIETLDDVTPGGEAVNDPGYTIPTGILIAKTLLALYWPPAEIWLGIEISSQHFGESAPAIDPNRAPQDETGGPTFGLILRSGGLYVPEQAGALRTEDWPTRMPDPTDNPRYDFIVDRDTQPWWPPRGSIKGYAGRWGPRVTNDPKSRRAGMSCPAFALMFLEAIARL